MDETLKPKRGFAAMSKEQRLAIASKGGKSVPHEKRNFSRDKKSAAAAGAKGGSHSPLQKAREAWAASQEAGQTKPKP